MISTDATGDLSKAETPGLTGLGGGPERALPEAPGGQAEAEVSARRLAGCARTDRLAHGCSCPESALSTQL